VINFLTFGVGKRDMVRVTDFQHR